MTYFYKGGFILNFGEYFRKLRTEHHMTQKEVAARLGVSRQAISHWENNKNLPDLEMLMQISETFDITLDQLLSNGENVSSNLEEDIDNTIKPTDVPSFENESDNKKQHFNHRHYTHKEVRHLKLNLLTFCIGAILLFFGVGYVGVDNGMENRIKIVTIICKSYILVPLGFLFIFVSIAAFLLFELKHLAKNIHRRTALKKAEEVQVQTTDESEQISITSDSKAPEISLQKKE